MKLNSSYIAQFHKLDRFLLDETQSQAETWFEYLIQWTKDSYKRLQWTSSFRTLVDPICIVKLDFFIEKYFERYKQTGHENETYSLKKQFLNALDLLLDFQNCHCFKFLKLWRILILWTIISQFPTTNIFYADRNIYDLN